MKFDPRTEPNPDAVANQSRNGFRYNPYMHPKGRWFQNTLKLAILKCIDFVHGKRGILRYDPEAYVYDDPRLAALDREITRLIEVHIIDDDRQPGRLNRTDLNLKIKDIALFMMKEDIYYRPRWIRLLVDLSDFIQEHRELFDLTAEEQENIDRVNARRAKQESAGLDRTPAPDYCCTGPVGGY